MPTLEQRTIRKVSWRLLPLIIVIYFVAYIDRTNVGFAALTMNKDLGLSAYVFGWGAGIFFLGYFLFEVPSNVILEKVGARVWIARIMITWGIVSGAMALVQGPVSFVVMRFLLGVAEAGFFPGMILYFTYWFPKAYRARVISALFIAVPGSNAVAAVISGAVLDMDGILGLAGWQWMFVVEAIPAVLLAFVVLAMMTDRPALATWLAPEEREWLETRLQDERRMNMVGAAGTATEDSIVGGTASVGAASACPFMWPLSSCGMIRFSQPGIIGKPPEITMRCSPGPSILIFLSSSSLRACTDRIQFRMSVESSRAV